MKTRFDEKEIWIASQEIHCIKKMSTEHLINLLEMFIYKPERTMIMLIHDVETQVPQTKDYKVWTKEIDENFVDIKKESIRNITSMSYKELTDYALKSPLGKSIKKELKKRGVNVSNIIENFKEEN